MTNTEELLNTLYLKKKGISLIMDEEGITTKDIMDIFYSLAEETKNLGVEYFRLNDYNVVFGDFITGIQYTKDDKKYYMMISANSRFATPQQIAVGTIHKENVYMMSEDFPSTTSISLMAFPKFAINQRTIGFVSKSYRDTLYLLRTKPMLLADDSKRCLECGFEAIEAFCSLVNQIKNQDKRKKLTI